MTLCDKPIKFKLINEASFHLPINDTKNVFTSNFLELVRNYLVKELAGILSEIFSISQTLKIKYIPQKNQHTLFSSFQHLLL